MKLSVVIVSYNVKYYLHQCLCSVERATRGMDSEILVVDNCSQDASLSFLRPRHPNVTFIDSGANLGFAKANNMAIRQSSGEFVLLLNPDTIVGENVISDVVAFMEEHEDAAGLGVMMLKPDGTFALESRRGIPTPFTAFCKMSGLSALFPKSRVFGRYYMQYLDRQQTAEIEVISGACMFLRRSTLDKSGLLDEDFFMYGEDVDLSYRLLLAGKKNYYYPAPILHYKGESTQKTTVRYVNMFHEAMFIFFRKHYGSYTWLFTLPVKAAIYLKAGLSYVRMQWRRLFHGHQNWVSHLRKTRFMFQGTADDYEAAAAVLQKKNIQLSDQMHGNGFVVMNAESHSYSEILELMQDWSREGLHREIATYYPSIPCIITSSFVFK